MNAFDAYVLTYIEITVTTNFSLHPLSLQHESTEKRTSDKLHKIKM
jgi:hypothetical protein